MPSISTLRTNPRGRSILASQAIALIVFIFCGRTAHAQEQLKLYVYSQSATGAFIDHGAQDRSDSARDLKEALSKSSVLRLSEDASQADLAVEVVDRREEQRGFLVQARLFSADRVFPLSGACRGACRWRSAAADLGDQIEGWVRNAKTNSPELLAKKPVRLQAPAGPIVPMSSDGIRAAIAFGAVAADSDFRQYLGRARFPRAKESDRKARVAPEEFLYSPAVSITTAFRRVAVLSMGATRQYKNLSESDVSDAVVSATVTVAAEPFLKGTDIGSPIVNVSHIVVAREGSSEPGSVVQPLSVEKTSKSWQNALGATRTGEGVTATFAPEVFRQGHELRIVTTDGREAVVPFDVAWLARLR